MAYYLCWEKGGGREWLVKAKNAASAREKLLLHQLIQQRDVGRIRCAPFPKKHWRGEVIE